VAGMAIANGAQVEQGAAAVTPVAHKLAA